MQLIPRNSNDIFTQFILNYTSEHTRVSYLKDLQEFFNSWPSIFQKPSDITLMHLIAYRDMLGSKNLAPASINRKMSVIKSFLNWLTTQGYISVNPASSLKLSKSITKSPTLAFTDEEVSRMLIATEEASLHRIVLIFLFYLGLRRSELVNIKLEDIYEDRGITILKIAGKGGKQRLIPINAKVKLELDNFLRKTQPIGLLINLSDRSIHRIVSRLAKRIGITKTVGAHSCRATVISYMLENGVSPRDVANFAGHSNINTTISIYDKKRDGLKNSAAYKVNYHV